MAFPFTFEENFELGTKGAFNSESDSANRLDVAHYADLAAVPGLAAPYRGAYCMRVNLATSTTDCYLQEDEGFDASAAATVWVRFMLWVSPTITMADADEFAILVLQSAGPVSEGVIVVNYTTANGLRLGVGETTGSQFLPLTTGVWHTVELKYLVDSGAGNDGTLNLYLDGSAATQVASLDQGAITQARLGVIGQDAGTTKGVLLFDQVITDDAQVYPPATRWPRDVLLTKSAHVFVGQGELANVTLLSGASTDNVVRVFDTDNADVNDAGDARYIGNNVTASEQIDPAGMPVMLNRGCYVELAGTNPRAMVSICRANGYGSDGAVRLVGRDRKTRRITGV